MRCDAIPCNIFGLPLSLFTIINTDIAKQTHRFRQISNHVPCICVRVLFLHAPQVSPFSAGVAPSDVHTAQHGHHPALYPLLHAGKQDPLIRLWVRLFSKGGLAPYQVQTAVQRHQAHPILCREQQHDNNWVTIQTSNVYANVDILT